MVVSEGDELWSRRASYVYTGNNVSVVTTAPFTAFLVEDRFTFRVFDTLLASSTLGVVSLAITSGLMALSAQSQNDSSWICVEDVDSIVNVYAQDLANSPRGVVVVISAVPEHGSLLVVDTSTLLAPGDKVASTCSDNFLCLSSVTYRPEKNYFNSPNNIGRHAAAGKSGVEYFKFYAVVETDGDHSNEIVQTIQVINSNDPSDIQCPLQIVSAQPVGTSKYSRSTSFFPLDRTTIEGFAVADPDEGVDVVKVVVFSEYGLVSLNQDYVDRLDFSSATYCYKDGLPQCSGSGTSDRTLVFVAQPINALMALDGMLYQSLASSVVDTINVTMLDGANGDCLDETKFQTESIRRECWRLSCTFNILVESRGVDEDDLLSSGLPAQFWISFSVGSLILVYIIHGWCSGVDKQSARGIESS